MPLLGLCQMKQKGLHLLAKDTDRRPKILLGEGVLTFWCHNRKGPFSGPTSLASDGRGN